MTKILTAALMVAFMKTAAYAQQPEPSANDILENAILITDKDCKSFGKEWRRYERLSGRFPLATGKGKDDREMTKNFTHLEKGGEYDHVLSIPEMPTHHHRYVDHAHGGGPPKVDYGDDRRQNRETPTRNTEPTGGNKGHNNMPPYLALNFCYKP